GRSTADPDIATEQRCRWRTKMNPVLDQSMYIDHDGNMFRRLPNWGRGQCGLLALIQLYDVLRNGVELGEVVCKTTGEPNDNMM
ncbi:unnamed protein product, partial [Ectocarpus sp. 12 AP-2014]